MSKPVAAADSGGLKPAGAFLNRPHPNSNPNDPNQPPVPLTETEQVQLQCDNTVLEANNNKCSLLCSISSLIRILCFLILNLFF